MSINQKAKGLTTTWLIIAGFILIAGSAYWYYVDDIKPKYSKAPALSAVEGWKTYRNEKYGFEVKYPTNWYIQGTRDETIFMLVDKQNIDDPNKSRFIVFGILKNCENSDWASRYGFAYYKTACISDTQLILEAQSDVAREVEDQILSTFKFTK